MKTRAISAVVMLAIFVPLLVLGGTWFDIAVFVLAFLALKEFIDMKETKKQLPFFAKVISYLFMALLIATNIMSKNNNLEIDFRILSAFFMTFLIPTILYHDKNKYSIEDAYYLIGGIFFLSLSFVLLSVVRNARLALIVYLFLITILTDTFAYLTGLLIGKHKMIECVSPKKTWEGSIGGTFMGVFISTVFYLTVINPDAGVIKMGLVGLFLSILAQFGDLVFSSIKRFFNKKDFSNLIPGHGGILDRLDSIIFVLLGFMFIWTIL